MLLYYLTGIAKFCCEALKTQKEMTVAKYDKLPLKNHWTPEIKKGTASILMSDGDPPCYHITLLWCSACCEGLWSIWAIDKALRDSMQGGQLWYFN